MADLEQEAEKFAMPAEGSEKYRELTGSVPEEEGLAEKIQQATGPLGDAIKANWKIILPVLAILLIAAWYFLLRPGEASLTVEASVLDSSGSAVVGATVWLLQEDGKAVLPEAITDDIGFAKISGIPAGKELTLKIEPVSRDLKPFAQRVAFGSKESRRLEAKLEKANSLSLTDDAFEYRVAQGCMQTLQVKVDNLGTSEFETQLISDGALGELVKAGEPKIIPPGGSETLSAALQMPAGAPSETKGKLRLKYTNREVSLTLQKADRKPSLSVSFEKGEAKDFRADAAELPVTKKSQVKLRNSGSSSSTPISEIRVSVRGDFAPWVQLDLSTAEEANGRGGIQPGAEVLFGFSVTVPNGTAKGLYSGQLIVESACETKPTPLSAKIE